MDPPELNEPPDLRAADGRGRSDASFGSLRWGKGVIYSGGSEKRKSPNSWSTPLQCLLVNALPLPLQIWDIFEMMLKFF